MQKAIKLPNYNERDDKMLKEVSFEEQKKELLIGAASAETIEELIAVSYASLGAALHNYGYDKFQGDFIIDVEGDEVLEHI